jgi:hypothetical protein
MCGLGCVKELWQLQGVVVFIGGHKVLLNEAY